MSRIGLSKVTSFRNYCSEINNLWRPVFEVGVNRWASNRQISSVTKANVNKHVHLIEYAAGAKSVGLSDK